MNNLITASFPIKIEYQKSKTSKNIHSSISNLIIDRLLISQARCTIRIVPDRRAGDIEL